MVIKLRGEREKAKYWICFGLRASSDSFLQHNRYNLLSSLSLSLSFPTVRVASRCDGLKGWLVASSTEWDQHSAIAISFFLLPQSALDNESTEIVDFAELRPIQGPTRDRASRSSLLALMALCSPWTDSTIDA